MIWTGWFLMVFRGEAIPSIASVSKFRLRDAGGGGAGGDGAGDRWREAARGAGGGAGAGDADRGAVAFYNLPARRKFLRTEATEAAHIRQTLILAGLARPEVGFDLSFDGNPPQRWLPGEDLGQRLTSIFGAEWMTLVAPLAAESGALRLHGFIGKPGVSRAARGEELFFINQRPVDNRTLHFGLLEGYHNSLMKGRYPVAVLFLEMDPSGIDYEYSPGEAGGAAA